MVLGRAFEPARVYRDAAIGGWNRTNAAAIMAAVDQQSLGDKGDTRAQSVRLGIRYSTMISVEVTIIQPVWLALLTRADEVIE